MDETITPPTKNISTDYKLSQQSSISSNNLLKPDSNPWSTNNNNDLESTRNKSQSISNIAGKFIIVQCLFN